MKRHGFHSLFACLRELFFSYLSAIPPGGINSSKMWNNCPLVDMIESAILYGRCLQHIKLKNLINVLVKYENMDLQIFKGYTVLLEIKWTIPISAIVKSLLIIYISWNIFVLIPNVQMLLLLYISSIFEGKIFNCYHSIKNWVNNAIN